MSSWIRVASDVHDDREVIAMSLALGVNVEQLVGHLVALWGRMGKHAQDGEVGSLPDATLVTWARWRGTADFASEFRARLCTDGVVRTWNYYNGSWIRKAEADAERKRVARGGAKKLPHAGAARGAARGAAPAAAPAAARAAAGARRAVDRGYGTVRYGTELQQQKKSPELASMGPVMPAAPPAPREGKSTRTRAHGARPAKAKP